MMMVMPVALDDLSFDKGSPGVETEEGENEEQYENEASNGS